MSDTEQKVIITQSGQVIIATEEPGITSSVEIQGDPIVAEHQVTMTDEQAIQLLQGADTHKLKFDTISHSIMTTPKPIDKTNDRIKKL